MKRIAILFVAVLVLAVASPADAKSPRPVGESKCVDATGDGNGADLGATILLADKRGLLTVIWETPVPLTGNETGRYVTISNQKGNRAYQIGLKVVGTQVSRFVFNFSTNKQRNLTTAANITDKGSSLFVPLSILPGLGKHPTWASTITANGKDADRCPEGALETVAFGTP